MPFYTVTSSQKYSRVSSFIERDLEGHAPSTVTDSSVHIIPCKAPSDAFNHIVCNIHDYALPHLDQVATTQSSDCKNVLRLVTDIPVPHPVVMIGVKGFDKEELKIKGLREEVSLDFPGEYMVSDGISYDQVRDLWKYGFDNFGPAVAGNVNLAGLYAFYMGWKAVGLFQVLIGGRYQHQIDLQSVWDEEENMAGGLNATLIGNSEAVRPFGEMKDGKFIVDTKDNKFYDAESVMSVVRTEVRSVHGFASYTTSLHHDCHMEGFLFPYFTDMVLPDKDFVAGVFFRYFSRCIADTHQGMAALIPSLRKGFRSLASTRAGRELQHIFFGIQGACETGGALRILVDKRQYHGFVLYTNKGKVLQNSILHGPTSRTVLQGEIQSLDSHSKSLKRLTELVAMVSCKVGGKIEMWDEEKAGKSSRYLANELQRRAFKGTDHEEEVNKKVESLRYGDKYWEINEENVIKILDCMLTGRVDEDEPFYLGGGMWNSDSISVRILSVFGEQAPTMSIRTGDKVISIGRPGDEDPNIVGGKDRKLPYLPYYTRGLLDAAAMWDGIPRQHSVRTAGAKKKAAGKLFNRAQDSGCVSGVKFVGFYEKLRTFAYGSPGGKRTQDREAEDVLSQVEMRVKKKRIAETEADFM
jgi:hypothetical protein